MKVRELWTKMAQFIYRQVVSQPKRLQAILNTVPFDMTFVDKDDKVKYFTQGKERIFARSRSIINRDVRLCHPPGECSYY